MPFPTLSLLRSIPHCHIMEILLIIGNDFWGHFGACRRDKKAGILDGRRNKNMQTMTVTQAKELFLKALTGNNYSERTIRAYSDDIEQFLCWVKSYRSD